MPVAARSWLRHHGHAVKRLDEGATLRITLAVVASVVVARSLAFLVFEGLNFNADEAIYGIMAIHLLEGRAFPLFTYGQGYILAVSVLPTLALLPLLGTTVLALRLPMLGYNVLTAVLLVTGLTRDARLSPWMAALATVPFVIAAPEPTAHLLMHVGGNVEPFVWILFLWMLRRRPALLGLVAGIGFLNREFTAYGLVGLAVVDVLDGEFRERRWWRGAAVAAAAFGLVLAVVAAVKPYSTYASGFARARSARLKGSRVSPLLRPRLEPHASARARVGPPHTIGQLAYPQARLPSHNAHSSVEPLSV